MKQANRLLYFLAFVKFIAPFLLQNGIYEPHRDEMLYIAEGNHLAWGFMEVPPLLSLLAWTTHIFGNSLFWLKFWPSFFGALTMIVSGKLVLALGGRSFGIFMIFLSFLLGAFLRMHFLFQPNFLEIFFWTSIAFATIRFTQTKQIKWLYILGICSGLGMLSKYSVLFFIVSLLLGLLLSNQRDIFRNKHFYYAVLIGLLIFMPNFIWQWQHHFPVAFHMNKLQQTQLQYISPASFLIDQLIMNFPVVFVWITGLFALLFVSSFKDYRFVGYAYFIVIGLMLLLHGKNYYAMGVYPVLLSFGSYQLEMITKHRHKVVRAFLIGIPLSMGYFLIPIALPIMEPAKLASFYEKRNIKKMGVLNWEDGESHPLPQDFADMLGWEEMASKSAKAFHSLNDSEKLNTLLFCDNYGEAGALNYYAKKYKLPETYSDNASFLYWMPDSLHFNNIVLVTDDTHEMEHDFLRNFKEVVLFDSIITPYSRERGSLILLLKGMNEKMRQDFKLKIQKSKKETSPLQ
jgi:hypothetical protein